MHLISKERCPVCWRKTELHRTFAIRLERPSARVAQLAEHLICNQKVAGSIPVAGSQRIQYTKKADAAQRRLSSCRSGLIGACLLDGHAESLHKIID